MRICLKIVLLLIISISVNAQQGNPDSLKQALKNAATDSARDKISRQLSNYYSENNRDSALYYLDQALLFVRKNNKQLDEARLLAFKGYQLMHLGKLPESYQCFPPAFKIAENPESENKTWDRDTSSTPRKIRLRVLQIAHLNFGHLMGSIGKTDQQIVQYQEAKKIAEERGDTSMLGLVSMNLGSVYFSLGKIDTALLMEDNAARMLTQTRSEKYLSSVYRYTGSLYLQKNNHELAVQYYHKAKKLSYNQRLILIGV